MNKVKNCVKCKEFKDVSEFNQSKQNRDGLSSWCKSCNIKNCVARRKQYPMDHRRHRLKRDYGLSLKQYDQMLAMQDGRCAICGNPPEGRVLCVDHSHETGKVRGLLCHHCNTALGMCKDDPGLLRKAAEYLEESLEED